MSTLLLAMRIAEKLNRSQMLVLKYFIEHGNFEGNYKDLAIAIYGNPTQFSNLRKYVNQLAKMKLLAVEVNKECNYFDTNRTFIALNNDWRENLIGA